MRNRLRSLAQWLTLGIVGAAAFAYVASGLGSPGAPDRAGDLQEVNVARGTVEPSGDVPPEEQAWDEGASQDHSAAPAMRVGDAAVVADLNDEFRRHWQARGVEPAPPAAWETVCRRLTLALVGTGMSLEEIRSLERLPESRRVAVWLDRLLEDPRFHNYWGERLARTYVGSESGPFIAFRRHRFVRWLTEALAENRPYDRLLKQLVTAEGLFTDRPEVNFLTVTLDSAEDGKPDPIRLAARSSRAFLGMRIDCLQCHDDFLGNVELGTASQTRTGTQQDFHRLAAFFGSARYNGFQGVQNGQRPYRYQYLGEDEETEVVPAVPFAADLVDPAVSDPRQRLADWMTHPQNSQTARAFVNRVWALLFGKPLATPVDEIPLHGPLPPGLDRLADDVVDHDWDLRRLIRAIVSSDVFQIDSRAAHPVDERHEQAWALFPLTPLRPEQVAGSIIQASRIKTVDRDGSFLIELQKLMESNDFVKRYGDTGEDAFSFEPITITQRLLLLNGKLVDEHTQHNSILNACTHISMFTDEADQAIEATYLTTLNRNPSDAELTHFTARLEAAPSRRKAIEDLSWVLMNSTEFAWNH